MIRATEYVWDFTVREPQVSHVETVTDLLTEPWVVAAVQYTTPTWELVTQPWGGYLVAVFDLAPKAPDARRRWVLAELENGGEMSGLPSGHAHFQRWKYPLQQHCDVDGVSVRVTPGLAQSWVDAHWLVPIWRGTPLVASCCAAAVSPTDLVLDVFAFTPAVSVQGVLRPRARWAADRVDPLLMGFDVVEV